MTNKQIKELYDSNPNMTLRELSAIKGKGREFFANVTMENGLIKAVK